MERGYILHRRPYQESSCIVNLLVEGKGRIDAIARLGGGRRSIKSLLQPCQPLLFVLSGKGHLKYLSQVESFSLAVPLQGKSLYSSMYLNELLMRTLAEQYSGEQLFLPYHQTLVSLAADFNEQYLRYFEKYLINELGTMPSLTMDANGAPIAIDRFYRYEMDFGFIAAEKMLKTANLYSGQALLRLNAEKLLVEDFNTIKRLMRQLLRPLIGNKPLMSRSLFARGVNLIK